jgi:hypothetical protein
VSAPLTRAGSWPGQDVPLDPSPAEGRDWLRRELLDPDYHEGDLLQRILTWLGRVVDGGIAVAERTPPLSLFAAMLVLIGLVLGLLWLLSRTDRSPGRRATAAPLVDDPTLTAAQLRARAEAAYAEGRWQDALVDAFRATATRQAERGRLDDLPALTAHEVGEALAASHPEQAAQVREVTRHFDEVLYGDRPGETGWADAALALDDALAGRRTAAR